MKLTIDVFQPRKVRGYLQHMPKSGFLFKNETLCFRVKSIDKQVWCYNIMFYNRQKACVKDIIKIKVADQEVLLAILSFLMVDKYHCYIYAQEIRYSETGQVEYIADNWGLLPINIAFTKAGKVQFKDDQLKVTKYLRKALSDGLTPEELLM